MYRAFHDFHYAESALIDLGISLVTWNNRGIALFGLGRLEEAVDSYNKALALDPKHIPEKENIELVLRVLRRKW